MSFLKGEIISNSALFSSLNSKDIKLAKSDISINRIHELENKYRGANVHYLDSNVIKVIQNFGRLIDQEVINYWKKTVITKTLTCSILKINSSPVDNSQLIDNLLPERINEHKHIYYPTTKNPSALERKYFWISSMACSDIFPEKGKPFYTIFFNYKSYFSYSIEIEEVSDKRIEISASITFDTPLTDEIIDIIAE